MNFSKTLDTVYAWIASVGLKLFWALIVVIASRILLKILLRQLTKERKKEVLDPTVKNYLTGTVKAVVFVLTVVIVVSILGIPMASVIAILASIGGAIALAMQGSLSNIAAGFVLMICKPIAVNDWIEVGEYVGVVVRIGLFYTTLKMLDGRNVEIPNGQLVGKTIVNQSSNGKRMGEIRLPVPYGTDVEALKEPLRERTYANKNVMKDQPVDVRLTELADSSMIVSVFYWVDPNVNRTAKLDLTEQLKSLLDERGIEVPFPQVDVHMKS
ncbi:MAG: mechanosensitive ion channel [Clostridia bacterium]|nr:mechanosensitive ion channel [Clostridia bacterium]